MPSDILLIDGVRYHLQKYALEEDLEKYIVEHYRDIFGEDSLYFDKQTIETQACLRARTDGFIISLDLKKWYIIEVELARHDICDHIIPQITKFSIAYENPETRKKLIQAFETDIKKDPKKQLMFELKGINEVYKFLSDVIDSEPVIVIPIDEKRDSDIERICKKLPFATRIVEFRTFRRTDAKNIHAHLYEPLHISKENIRTDETRVIKIGDMVKLKGERPNDVSEWSWSRVVEQERSVKEVWEDTALLIIDNKTRGFWFPIKCLEKVGVFPSEKEIQGPTETSEWSEKELFEFLKERNDTQLAFLKTLAEHDKVYIDDLLSRLKRLLGNKFSRYIGGALGGLNRAIDLAEKELLHYSDWDEQGRFYKVESKYRDIIKRYFSQQE